MDMVYTEVLHDPNEWLVVILVIMDMVYTRQVARICRKTVVILVIMDMVYTELSKVIRPKRL